ncbi:MAG: PD40 domain-containing protein [Acidobacteria bacterium]|nr:PD40 domain-containing protein [Acidobacteriota bacterium]
MKHWIALMVLLCAAWTWAAEARFLSDPTLSPDGSSVVFAYQGDLWRIPAEGGTALRLTGMRGEESQPRYSPDGRWLAFTGSQDGNGNVYVMPVTGGEIRQLTYHDANDLVDSWSWDSQQIYFTSDRYNNFSAYRVARTGGTPVRLFSNFFNTPHGIVENPRTGAWLFTDTWESFRFAHRKRYKGDYNPDLKTYHPETKEFEVLTTYRGKDFWPTIDRAGNIYFVSDEANGEYNLYTITQGRKTPLTAFPTSVITPQVNADGGRLVFVKDYQLFRHDLSTGNSIAIPVNLFVSDTLELEQSFDVAGKISTFAASPDGKKLAFISRGELFVGDSEGKFIRQMTTRPDGRIMEVAWLADNLTLVYNQTVDGWLNWFRITADGKTAEVQITRDSQSNRNLTLNSDRSQGVYLSGRSEVRLLDLKTWASRTIATDELWAMYNPDPRFSPDDRYVAFTAYRNFETDILLADLQENKIINITDTGVTETSPYWSPDGKYLYFASDRGHPSYPRGDTEPRIYRLPLQKFDEAFKSAEFEKLFEKKEKDRKDEKEKAEPAADAPDKPAGKEAAVDKEKQEKATPAVTVTVDFEDMLERLERISPNRGQQGQPVVLQEKEVQTVLYISDHDGEGNNVWKTVIAPFKPNETKKIEGARTGGLTLAATDKKQYLLVRGDIHELDLKANKVKKIELKHKFTRQLRQEFRQMFEEVWAAVAENFYDGDFHGTDWDAIGRRYRQLLPFVTTRGDLRTLVNDMLGELNASHMGFYSSGEEEKTFYNLRTAAPGIRFATDRPYVVEAVVKDSPVDREGKDLAVGDVLVAVDGQAVDPERNRESYFLRPDRAEEMILSFRRDGETFDVRVHPQSSVAFRSLLYSEWIAENQRYVDERSDKQIAYIHMPDMGGGSLNDFLVEMTSEWYRREALILDLRFNRGGNVHDDVLQFLSQRPYTQWKYRDGKMSPQPNFAPAAKPIILLVNEQSLSDAEMTAAGFRALELGTIIGTETYRWLIFTSGRQLVDGSFCRLPAWGCFTLDGRNIETEGVAPDIYIKTTLEDRLAGRDPQLDRAIEEIRKDMHQ